MIPKVLIATDLDYTVFNSVTVLGTEDYWVGLFNEISQGLARRKIELVFAVVTSKGYFDNVSAIAARMFQSFLSRHNPDMIIHANDRQWCLVNHNNRLYYESIAGCDQMDSSQDLLSHFAVTPHKDKSIEIIKIAKHHQIPLECCVMLDDTPRVLAEVAAAGINTVAFDCFHPKQAVVPNLNDSDYVNRCLSEKKSQLLACIEKMCDAFESVKLDV